MADPLFESVFFLLNIGDTGLTDQSNFGFGVDQPNGSQSFPGSAIAFDGVNDYWQLIGPGSLGTDDFTLEFVFRFDSLSGTQVFFTNEDGTPTDTFQWRLSGGAFQILVNGVVKHSFTPSNLTIYQMAWVREGSTFRFFVDGVKQGSDVTLTPNFNGSDLQVGATFGTPGSWYSGRFYNCRFTTAAARYSANYTPVSVPFDAFLATITGVTKDAIDVPAPFTVRALNRSTGAILFNGASNGSGVYTFDVRTNDEIQVIVHDAAASPLLNDKIIRVLPLGP